MFHVRCGAAGAANVLRAQATRIVCISSPSSPIIARLEALPVRQFARQLSSRATQHMLRQGTSGTSVTCTASYMPVRYFAKGGSNARGGAKDSHKDKKPKEVFVEKADEAEVKSKMANAISRLKVLIVPVDAMYTGQLVVTVSF